MRIILPFQINVGTILSLLGAYSKIERSASIFSFCTDSRECLPSDLYFCLSENEERKEIYSAEAVRRGAYVLTDTAGERYITVTDLREAILTVAKYYKEKCLCVHTTVAVTGSSGKTTLKEILRHTLSKKYKVHATEENQNNEIGLFLTLLSAPIATDVLILELGMNAPGEIGRMSRCIQPDIAVITNVGRAHIGNFGSRKWIAQAKKEIAEGMHGGPIFTPTNDPYLSDLENKITVGCAEADYLYTAKALGAQSFEISVAQGLYRNTAFVLPFPSANFASSFAYALAVADRMGCSPFQVRDAFCTLSPSLFHFHITERSGRRFLYDCYNASPDAIENSLHTLFSFDGGKAVLLGDMLELGRKTEEEHRAIGALVAKLNPDRAYFYGVYAPFYAEGAREGGYDKEKLTVYSDTAHPQKLTEIMNDTLPEACTVLCKASHAVHLEQIVDRIV